MVAPQNLTATATGTTSIDLSADPPSSGTVFQYRIYRATTSGTTTGDYTEVDQTDPDGDGGMTYSDTGLNTGERYYYRVTADLE